MSVYTPLRRWFSIDGILLAIWFYEISLCGKKKKKKKCPWHFENARDKSQNVEKCPWHLPVTFLPVTFPKRPWQFSKKCPWHRKNGRDKFQKSNVTPIKKCHGKKKNTASKHRTKEPGPLQSIEEDTKFGKPFILSTTSS